MIKSQKIEKIHQILITDDDTQTAQLPPAIWINSESHRTVYRQAQYKLWRISEIQDFIRNTFPQEVIKAFDILKPYSYKSDLARFCILFIEGGAYIDLAVRSMNALFVPQSCGIAAFRDVAFISPSWSTVQTGLLWAEPGRPEFQIAIDWIVENCARRYYGENPLYPTGPVLLGRAFIKAMAQKAQSESADDQRVGECRCVTPEADLINMTYVSKEGVVVGIRTKAVAGDLTQLGFKGVNNYNEMWRTRNVYGESERVWGHDDPSIRLLNQTTRTAGAISVDPGAQRRVTFGPYVDLQQGRYVLTVHLADSLTNPTGVAIDVSAFDDGNVFASEPTIDPTSPNLLKLTVIVLKRARACEFRLRVNRNVGCKITKFTLAKHDAVLWSAADPKIETIGLPKVGERVILVPDRSGRVLYGPYATIERGVYDLDIFFSADTRIEKLDVEIAYARGEQVLVAVTAKQEMFRGCIVYRVQFEAKRDLTDVEYRVSLSNDSAGQFVGYVLAPKKPPIKSASGQQSPKSKSFLLSKRVKDASSDLNQHASYNTGE